MNNTKKKTGNAVTKLHCEAAMKGLECRLNNKFDKFSAALCELTFRVQTIEENMYTKQDHAKFMIWMDEAMKELRDTRQERVLFGRQFVALDDKVHGHEKRICVLEKKGG